MKYRFTNLSIQRLSISPYTDLRSAHGTQKEHMQIAEAVRSTFTSQFPAVSAAVEWTREDCPECQDAPSICIE